MLDIIKICMSDTFEKDDITDEQTATSFALKKAVAVILERELTKRQRECLKLFYLEDMTQEEIAKHLKLNQSTVSRHLVSAKRICEKILSYCYYSVNQANEQWLKMI